MIADFINSGFNIAAGAFVMLNVRRVWRDREVRGASPWTPAFFAAWGLWNLWFYPSVSCWASFVGGLGVLFANVIYLFLMVRFSSKE